MIPYQNHNIIYRLLAYNKHLLERSPHYHYIYLPYQFRLHNSVYINCVIILKGTLYVACQILRLYKYEHPQFPCVMLMQG